MTVHVLRQSVQLTVVVEPWEYTAGCRGCGHLGSLCTLVGAGSGTWRSARRRLDSSRNSIVVAPHRVLAVVVLPGVVGAAWLFAVVVLSGAVGVT